jgi:hypothetical protein
MSADKFYDFLGRIEKFNAMYKMPTVNTLNYADVSERLTNFEKILREECEEMKDVTAISRMDVLTNLSDLLGDIIVYCASEAKRWNIPIAEVLDIIMDSNDSKLDENGNPIYDERGKVMKGPNYWKPEPKIRELLERHFNV